MNAFDAAFERLVGHEGGYTANPADPGNWTGGACGRGQCLGTRWGVSAAAYPGLDIKTLTLVEARAIYRRDYWDRIGGDKLAPAVAYVMFDAAVNNGVWRSVQILQVALNLKQDGVIGPATLAEAGWAEPQVLVTELVARRILFMSKLATWPTFGLGWARRLAALPMEALEVARHAGENPAADASHR